MTPERGQRIVDRLFVSMLMIGSGRTANLLYAEVIIIIIIILFISYIIVQQQDVVSKKHQKYKTWCGLQFNYMVVKYMTMSLASHWSGS